MASQNNTDICPICQEEFKEATQVKTLECTHKFHTDCIQKWIELRNLCPLCNKIADSSQPVRELNDDRQDLSQQMIQNLIQGAMNPTRINFWVDLLQGNGGILAPMSLSRFPHLYEVLNIMDIPDNHSDEVVVHEDIFMQGRHLPHRQDMSPHNRDMSPHNRDMSPHNRDMSRIRHVVPHDIIIPPDFFAVEEFSVHPERVFSSNQLNQNVLQDRGQSLMGRFLSTLEEDTFLPDDNQPEQKSDQNRHSSRFSSHRRPTPYQRPTPPQHSHELCQEKAQCANCFDIKCVHVIKRCGRCKQIRYCSRECQEKDWAAHKYWCERHSN